MYFVASARTEYASRLIQVIDGVRTLTPLDPQPCRLLILLNISTPPWTHWFAKTPASFEINDTAAVVSTGSSYGRAFQLFHSILRCLNWRAPLEYSATMWPSPTSLYLYVVNPSRPIGPRA